MIFYFEIQSHEDTKEKQENFVSPQKKILRFLQEV